MQRPEEVSGLRMLHPPSTQPGFSYLCTCSYTGMGHPVIEVLTQLNRFLPPHLMTETDPVSEILCSVVLRIPDGGQS
jgi:hypothetical protein